MMRGMPTLDRITIYPVKSLDGVDVTAARVLPGGALEHDRRWQLVDMEGRVVNAKWTPLCHAIRAEFDLAPVGQGGGRPEPGANRIHLAIDPAAVRASAIPGVARLASLAADSFPLVPGPDGPCGWLGEALGVGVLLLERPDGGFPDDRDAPGPTLVSTASLAEVARWFSFDLDEARRRFRANLEVGGCDAFWEDALASPARPDLQPSLLDLAPDEPADPYADLPPPEPREFTVGDVRFRAANVCRRCVVPSRDSRTGAVTELFREVFEARRARGLPAAVDAGEWGTLYRLAVNVRPGGAGGPVAVGAAVRGLH
jgi:uncharacterized protein YcbX